MLTRPTPTRLLLVVFALALSAPLQAREGGAGGGAPSGEPVVVEVELTDGSAISATSIEMDQDTLRAISPLGIRLAIPVDVVGSVRYLPAGHASGETTADGNKVGDRPSLGGAARLAPGAATWPSGDPSYSRLMLAPTGRPLAAGERYVANHLMLFPSYAWGATDNISLLGGLSVVPGVPPHDQLRYLAPRVSHAFSAELSGCAGALLAGAGVGDEGGSAGLLYSLWTYGDDDQSLTFGLGYGWTRHDGDTDWLGGPVIGIGGSRRLSEHLALVSESWIITGEGLGAGLQPFGVALRFFSGDLAADVGAILIGEALEHGFPIPWLSFTYHLGG